MARRSLALLVALGIVVLSASAAPAGTGSQSTAARYNCGGKKMLFYFWPQGHQAVPSIKFTPYTTPHMEAYSQSGAFYAFADANGQMSFAKTCTQVGNLPSRWASAKRKTITTTMEVLCTFPVAGELNAAKVGPGGVMSVTLGHSTKQVLVGNLRATGSTITFDTRFCHTAPAPAQAQPTKYAFTGLKATFSLNGFAVTYTVSGEVCGDPTLTPWTVAVSFNGATPNPQTAVLQSGTAANVAAIVSKDSAGNELTRATIQLTFNPGPPAQMTLGVLPSNGLVTNVQVSGSPATVTATPVPSC